MLEGLDGSRLAGTFAGDRLKKFHPRRRLRLDRTADCDQEVLPTLEGFLATMTSQTFLTIFLVPGHLSFPPPCT